MPSREHVKKALKVAKTKVAYDYFFKKLNSPDWIEPLAAEGVFESPSNVYEINGILQASFWEPSKYLARMASLAPEKVLSIINKIPPTDNPRIHEDFINAALAMPPQYAKKLRRKAIHSLDNPYQLSLPSKVTEFAVYFLKAHLTDDAMELCKSLLDIKSSEKKYQSYEHRFINDWELNEKIKEISCHLENYKEKINFAKLLCNKLKKCIKYEAGNEGGDTFKDGSCYWRQTIANPNNNIGYDTKDILINWIIGIYESLLNKKPELNNEIIQSLLQQPLPVFSRIALYLAGKHLSYQDLIISLLLNEKLALSNDAWHDYSVLLKNSYSDLSQDNKKLMLDFIYGLKFYPTSEENYQEKNKRRQYRFLYIISEFLENDDKFNFDAMYKKYGEIDNPTFLFYMTGGSVGFNSPINLNDFDKKSIQEISDYLNNWIPSANDSSGESIEGLANVLQSSVSKRYAEYIPALEELIVNKCIYLRSIIYGLEKSATETNSFDWKSVLNFLILATRDNKNLEVNNDDIDAGVSGIRDAACRLLEKSFALKSNELSIEYKELVWEVIHNCLTDPDPSIYREKKLDTKDYYQFAINSTRSIALECGIQYGLWVMRILNISREKSDRNNYTELFDTLDKHLNTKFERSIAVHSIYGRWLPWLHLLDRNWTSNHVALIFPHHKSKKDFFNAAWSAYILYSQPYDEIFDLIKSEYLNVIKSLNYSREKSQQIETRLLDQVVIFYLNGKINFNDELMTTLFNKNNIEILKHLVSFTGRVTSNDLKIQAIELWGGVLNKCEQLEDYSPLEEFGWWVQLNYMDDEWILDQLLIVLSKNKIINQVHSVMERLILSAEVYPKKTAQIFQLIVENRIREYGFFMWRDRAESLILILLETDAKKEAITIIQKLGALGFTEFGRLLN